MRFLIGCSGAFALVAFIIGFTVSLFVRDASWMDRLTMAITPAVIAFVAVLLLASRDSAKHSATMRSVRNNLLAGVDTSDDDFISSRPFDDATLLRKTREAISRFFDVPTDKIRRDVELIHELHVDKLEPSFQFYVVEAVIASHEIEPKPFRFSMAGLETIDDLAEAIRNVLDGLDRNTDNQDKPEG
jgi:hypothetical protein